MNRIRIGNDFLVAWRIKRAGINEDLTLAKNMSLVATVKSDGLFHSQIVPFEIIDDSIVRIEITPLIAKWVGVYNFVFKYEFEYPSYADNNEKCTVDKNIFIIVGLTADADDITFIECESDVLIGLKGEKGDSAFVVWQKENGADKTYQDWIDFLQSPANDAIADADAATVRANNAADLANTKAGLANDAATLATQKAGLANDAADLANEKAGNANDAAILANEKAGEANEAANRAESSADDADAAAGLANSAANLANEKAGDANDAALLANEKAGEANTQAIYANEQGDYALEKGDYAKEQGELAQTARENIEGDLALKIDKTSITSELGDSEELVMSQKGVKDEITQLDSEVSLFKEESNLKDAIQDSKIKDIESIISTMNPNQSAQLSVSGVSPLSLPKNAANGGMSVKLEGLTAENLVVNGDFNSSEGWTVTTQGTIVDGELVITALNSNPWQQSINASIGDMVYFGGICYTLSGAGLSGTPLIRFLDSNSNSLVSNQTEIPTRVSGVHTVAGGGTLIRMNGFYLGNVDHRFDKIFAINLTETFGAGNEPTKEQCDLIFSDYFEGVKSFEPTGRVRSVGKNGLNSTALYLTTPELRSNGLVKDEIRKGANGYELVKRVGVGASNGEIVTGGDFSDPTKWTVSGGTSIISNGTLKIIADVGSQSSVTQNKTITAGKIYRYKIDVLSSNGTVYLRIGNELEITIKTADSGKTISGFFLSSTGGTFIRLGKEISSNVSTEFDNISILEYNATEGVAIAGGEAVYGGNIHYTLATPVITPIPYGGILNSTENGTVYHEPIIADAGVYDTKMDILLTDYPIATIEEIIKHENGIDTYLNATTAVIAGDGLSFTHPNLTSGDLVLFTYAYDKESTNGNITASFYDSNVVKIDTETGKAYKIDDVVTNGILTRTLTEV